MTRVAPAASVAQRRLLDDGGKAQSMLWIMAIMMFLTTLAGAFGLGALATARSLDKQLAGRLTVQLVEADPARRAVAESRLMALLQAHPDVARAASVDRGALVAMLRPWLGDQGDMVDLPIPAMIDVEVLRPDPTRLARIADQIARAVPAARLDRYESWMSPVARFMQLMIALAAGLVVLMALAMTTVVALAARAGLDRHRETIDVLHIMGSTDGQIARLFQRRIARDALVGGVIGAAVGLVLCAFVGGQLAGLGADLVGGVRFGVTDWLVLIALPVLFALLAIVAARLAVLRLLEQRL
ncbi:MAG: permease [Sphingobium sp.]|nr:permease [Sphingobium sp.]